MEMLSAAQTREVQMNWERGIRGAAVVLALAACAPPPPPTTRGRGSKPPGPVNTVTCPAGSYDLDGDPANGCESTCDRTGCIGPDGGAWPIAVPPELIHTDAGLSLGGMSAGAQISEPMTSS